MNEKEIVSTVVTNVSAHTKFQTGLYLSFFLFCAVRPVLHFVFKDTLTAAQSSSFISFPDQSRQSLLWLLIRRKEI